MSIKITAFTTAADAYEAAQAERKAKGLPTTYEMVSHVKARAEKMGSKFGWDKLAGIETNLIAETVANAKSLVHAVKLTHAKLIAAAA